MTLDPQRAANVLDVTFVQGGWTGLTDSSILVSKDKADRDKLALGSKLDVSFLDDSRATLTVGGIFDSKVLGNLIVTRTLIADRGKFSLDAQIVVNATPGTSVGAASVAIKTVTDKYPTVKFESRDQFIASQSADIQGPLNFIYALLGMSVFIAVLGIVLTLLLAVYERRRELGLSRAIGMTQSQVRASIRWEAIVTAMLGAAMGTGLGVALGWIIVRALRDEGLSVFRISPISIVIFAVLAILFAVVAAWIPARRGARADILSAIATT